MNEAIEGEFAWHVDAWDPLAGRAFAVWRPSEGGDTPELEYQSVFLGPPHFQPELVSARSLGIAAARASFQLGLFVDGAEVRFASLDEIVSLVRRGYAAGGTGFEPGGATPLPPVLPLAPEGEVAFEPHVMSPEGGIGAALSRALGAATEITIAFAESTSTAGEISQEVPRPEAPANVDASEVRDLLLRGARAILRELLHRVPDHNNPDELYSWADIAVQLKVQMFRLGIDDAFFEVAKGLPQSISGRFEEAFGSPPGQYHWWLADLGQSSHAATYDLLRRLPLPARTQMQFPHARSLASVMSLLDAIAGLGYSPDAEERAISLFAAACLVSFRDNLAGGAIRMASDGYYRRLGRDAWRWLTAQLPDRVFQPALEQALFAVPGLRTAENFAEPDFEPEAAPADEISRLSPEEYQDLRHGPLGHLLEDVEDDEVSEDIELPESPTSYLTL